MHSVVSTGCQVHINKHTRITKTLLDHVYSNYQPDKVVNKIVLSELSPNDHFSTFSKFYQCKVERKKPEEIYVRKKFMSVEELIQFNEDLFTMVNSQDYKLMTDVNEKATYVINCYIKLIDKYMPLRKLSKKEKKFYFTPWITKDLQKEIERREILFKIKLDEGTEEAKEAHRKFKNKLSKKLFSAKQKFLQKKVYDSEGDKAKMWKVINQISNGCNFSSKKSKSIKELIDKYGNVITEQKKQFIVTYLLVLFIEMCYIFFIAYTLKV